MRKLSKITRQKILGFISRRADQKNIACLWSRRRFEKNWSEIGLKKNPKNWHNSLDGSGKKVEAYQEMIPKVISRG